MSNDFACMQHRHFFKGILLIPRCILGVLETHVQVDAGQQYQVEYACSCCGLFGGSGDCCQPLSSCSYLTPTCGSAKPITQAYFVS